MKGKSTRSLDRVLPEASAYSVPAHGSPNGEEELTEQLFEGIEIMQESTTYQKILRDGRKEGENMGRVD